MTQIAISPAPQPAPQTQATQAASTTGGDGQDFSTTLDQTIQEQQQPNSQPDSQHNTVQSQTDASPQQPETTKSADEQSDIDNVDEQPAGLAEAILQEQNQQLGNPEELNVKQSKAQLFGQQAQNKQQTVIANTNLQPEQAEPVKLVLQNPALATNQAPAPEIQQPLQNQTEFKIEPGSQQVNGVQDNKASILAQKIDQLISSSSEKGVAAIRVKSAAVSQVQTGTPANTPALSIMPEEVAAQASVATTVSDKALFNGEQNNSLSKVAQMRMEAAAQTNQEAKIDPTLAGSQSNQQSLSDNTGSQNPQLSNMAQPQTAAPGSEQNQNFSSVISNQPTEVSQSQTAARPAFTMSHPHVNENQLMDQVIQRFNVNPRLQTSKLTMQLNPAELGELKIDILVKGDSIKASIVAQNQQVQDIIEKNMVKLRSVLEDQGFSIDDLVVTSSEDGSDAFNMFQQSFADSQQSPESGKKSQSSDFELPLEDFIAANPQEDVSGVNVKI